MLFKRLFLAIAIIFCDKYVQAFMPKTFLEQVVHLIDDHFLNSDDVVGDTKTHDEIIKRGVIESVVSYFYDQSNGKSKINLSKINEYFDLTILYHDYYDVWLCETNLDSLIKYDLQSGVASVDFDSTTKDLPYAHFDAETFRKSNQRVIKLTTEIHMNIRKKNYKKARNLAGQVLHTIQDFYSHSNWIESGKKEINKLIGTAEFNSLKVIDPKEPNPCVSNCTAVTVQCSSALATLSGLITATEIHFDLLECPFKYYVCKNNVIVTDKLVSGYYADQKIENGQPYLKPFKLNKCSHGGILDSTSKQNATGGMNKDTSYYILSPHADLHSQAVDLAIKHTKYFFDQLRQTIGDPEFANFFELKISDDILNNKRFKVHVECKGTLSSKYQLGSISILFFLKFLHNLFVLS